jgi:hypothetical protein
MANGLLGLSDGGTASFSVGQQRLSGLPGWLLQSDLGTKAGELLT